MKEMSYWRLKPGLTSRGASHDYRCDKNLVYPGYLENPYDFFYFYPVGSGYPQSRRSPLEVIVRLSDNSWVSQERPPDALVSLARHAEATRSACLVSVMPLLSASGSTCQRQSGDPQTFASRSDVLVFAGVIALTKLRA